MTALTTHARARIAEATGYALAQLTAGTPGHAAANLAHIHRTHGRPGAAAAALLTAARIHGDNRPLPEPDDPRTVHLLHRLARATGTPPPISSFACLLAAHRAAQDLLGHLARGDRHRATRIYLDHAAASTLGACALTALLLTAATAPAHDKRPAATATRRTHQSARGVSRTPGRG